MIYRMDSGNNPANLLVSNRSLVVKLLKMHGTCSRSELSRLTNLTQAAITKIVANLIDFGIVEEIGLSQGKRGRRSILLRLKKDSFYIIGVYISKHCFSIGLFDIDGKCNDEINIYDIPLSQPPTETMLQVEAEISKRYRKNRGVIAAGIATSTYMISQLRNKSIVETSDAAYHKYQYQSNMDINLPIFIGHDVKAGALAEWWFGEHNSRFLVNLLVGSGVSVGVIMDGKLLLGKSGIAGEIGHMIIDMEGRKCPCAENSKGCLEQYCSTEAFMRDVTLQLPNYPNSSLYAHKPNTPDDVFLAANQGDTFAVSVVKQLGYYLGISIINIFRMYNPDTIVISDVMAHGGDIMLDAIMETVSQKLHPAHLDQLTIRYSRFQENASLLGAVAIAVDKFLQTPVIFASEKG